MVWKLCWYRSNLNTKNFKLKCFCVSTFTRKILLKLAPNTINFVKKKSLLNKQPKIRTDLNEYSLIRYSLSMPSYALWNGNYIAWLGKIYGIIKLKYLPINLIGSFRSAYFEMKIRERWTVKNLDSSRWQKLYYSTREQRWGSLRWNEIRGAISRLLKLRYDIQSGGEKGDVRWGLFLSLCLSLFIHELIYTSKTILNINYTGNITLTLVKNIY